MGLPESGKTTFLAAFGYTLLFTEKKDISLESCNSLDYLTDIAQRWANCEKMGHNAVEDVKETRLKIREKSGEVYDLVLPDRDGEYFWAKRRDAGREKEFHSALHDSEAILFFMNPGGYSPEPMFGEVVSKFVGEDAGNSDQSKDEQKGITDGKQEDYELGIQAEHIALIGSMLDAKIFDLKIKIIVSAWDLFMDDPTINTPEDAIKKHFPMIWQKLWSYADQIEVEYWGLSAQGGDWESSEVEKLRDKKPEDRVIVVNADGAQIGDITRILL